MHPSAFTSHPRRIAFGDIQQAQAVYHHRLAVAVRARIHAPPQRLDRAHIHLALILDLRVCDHPRGVRPDIAVPDSLGQDRPQDPRAQQA